MKKLIYAITIACCLAAYGQTFNWGTAGQVLLNQEGELLPGNMRDPSEAGFVQLLYLGPGGTYDEGHREVIAKSWVGDGAAFVDFVDGSFDASERPATTGYNSGVDSFAIRVFDTPSPNWDEGLIPETGHYNYFEFLKPLMDVDERYNLVIDSQFEDSFTINRLVHTTEQAGKLIIVQVDGILWLGELHKTSHSLEIRNAVEWTPPVIQTLEDYYKQSKQED